jgi:hypothetical protein
MKLHFPWAEVEKLLAEVNAAKTARPLYEEETGKGFWLAGDQGVYLMANTSDGPLVLARKDGESHFVVYADECDPTKLPFDEWWANKRMSFGGDDGADFIPLASVEALRKLSPSHLVIDFRPNQFVVTATKRKPIPKTKG